MSKATGRSRRVSNSLVGLGSAAVLTIYGAGYVRTRPAAARVALAAERRAAAPAYVPPLPIAPPAPPAEPAPRTEPVAVPPAATAPAAARTRTRRVAAAAPAATAAPRATRVTELPASAAPVMEVAAPTTPAAAAAAPATPAPVAADAAAPPVALPPPAAPPAASLPAGAAPKWKDGTFLGWGSSRHGDIQASVEVRAGRIVSATIAQCLTRYSCSWIAPLPPQVVARQSPEVDYVSGATQSTNAFYDAVVDALSKAK